MLGLMQDICLDLSIGWDLCKTDARTFARHMLGLPRMSSFNDFLNEEPCNFKASARRLPQARRTLSVFCFAVSVSF